MGANAQRLGAGDRLVQQLASVGGLDRGQGAGLGHHLVEFIQLDGTVDGAEDDILDAVVSVEQEAAHGELAVRALAHQDHHAEAEPAQALLHGAARQIRPAVARRTRSTSEPPVAVISALRLPVTMALRR